MPHRAQASVCSAGGSRRLPLVGRAAGVLAAVAATGVTALALGAAPALADSCPNAAVRLQNNSTGLSDCRAYELVTNPFKEGYAPAAFAYADGGAVAAYQSSGVFAGGDVGSATNQYVATRSATGWLTSAPQPPGAGPNYSVFDPADISADLRSSFWRMRRQDESTDVQDYYFLDPGGALTRIGPALNPASLPAGPVGTGISSIGPIFQGSSTDLSHVIFTIGHDYVFPGDASSPATSSSVYEYVGTGNVRPRLVGVDNGGHQITNGDTCAGSPTSRYHAISTDGRVIFFTPNCSGSGQRQAWARINGTTSVEMSASQCTRISSDPGGACNAPAAATFEGADADGSRAYFTTTQQLVDGDTDQTEDLYACDIPSGAPAPTGTANSCSALDQVSGTATGADVKGVTRISDDGSRVYFVAGGVLAGNLGANDQAALVGDNNLYVWEKDAAHPSGQTTFVAKLDLNDSGLWGLDTSGRMAQTTDDGRYLVLSTSSPLVDSGPGADTDDARDIYRYDAQTGALARLSTGGDGDGGNEAGLDATISPVGYQTSRATIRSRTAITSDAGTAVFLTSESLSDQDTNGTSDVYAWHDGQVSLITSGSQSVPFPPGSSLFAVITESGHDVFFSATQRLTPADGDTNVDFYDARVNGGFDFTRPAPCSGDQCQPGPGRAPAASVSASDTTTGDADAPLAAPQFVLQKVSSDARKRLASTGRITLKVSASTPGTLTATLTATVAHKPVRVASAQRTLAAPGTTTLTLTLSKKARAQLAAEGKLTVKVLVSNSKVAARQAATLKLTHAKATKKVSGRKATKRRSVNQGATADRGGRS
jgi:hypothetical protein